MEAPERLVFLSYHKRNLPVAKAIAAEFEARRIREGLNVALWFDQRLEGGDIWDAVIQEKMDQADIILFLATTASLQATYMWYDELWMAKRRMAEGARVIPLQYNEVAAHIHLDPETRRLQRLPSKAVDELGESAWLAAVIDGVFRAIASSLAQRTSASQGFADAHQSATNCVGQLERTFRGTTDAVYGAVRGSEILDSIVGCRLALDGADPRQISRNIEGWRRRLAPARAKLSRALPELATEIARLVHLIEDLQMWAGEDQPEPPLDGLPASQFVDSNVHGQVIGDTSSTLKEADQTIKKIGERDDPLSRDLSSQATLLLDQAQLNLGFAQVDVSALRENIEGFARHEEAYSQSRAVLGRPTNEVEVDDDLRRSAERLSENAQALSQAYRSTPAAPAGEHKLYDLAGEVALLGAILFENNLYHQITSELRPDHFYDPVNGRIFEALGDLVHRGRLADGVTLREYIGEGSLNEVGGSRYLIYVMERAFRAADQAIECAKRIYDLARRRELIRIGSAISNLAQSPPQDVDAATIIDDAGRTLLSLRDRSRERGFSHFSSALGDTIEKAASGYEKSGVSGLATYFDAFDEATNGLLPRDVILIEGASPSDSSTLALNIAYNVARARLKHERLMIENDGPVPGGIVAYFSLESSAEFLSRQLLARTTGIGADRIARGQLTKHEYERLTDEAVDLQKLPLHIDEGSYFSVRHLHSRAARLGLTLGVDLLVVDNLERLLAEYKGARATAESEIFDELKEVAVDLRIPVILTSGPRRVGSKSVRKTSVDLYMRTMPAEQFELGDVLGFKVSILSNRHGADGGHFQV